MSMVERYIRLSLLPTLLLMSAGLLTPAGRAEAQGARAVQATVVYQLRVRRPERGEFDANATVDFRLNVGGDGRVTGSVTRSTQGPRGPVSTSRQVSGVLGRPKEIAGSGHGVMISSGSTLTLLRTFEVGGNKTTITFSGGGCSIRAPLMQEVGAGPIKRDAIVGGTIEILSARQVSSSCRVGG